MVPNRWGTVRSRGYWHGLGHADTPRFADVTILTRHYTRLYRAMVAAPQCERTGKGDTSQQYLP